MSIIGEKGQLNEAMANDVVSLQYTTTATEEPIHNDHLEELIGSSTSGAVSLSSVKNYTTNETTSIVPTVTSSNTDSTEEDKMIPNFANINLRSNRNTNIQNNRINNNNGTNSGNMKAKRRRRKSSKQKTNSKPYKKTNWNFQKRARNSLSRLVPYNTNQFLMEEHMPEINEDGGRCRDSSFSFDSDNDKEEYFSKEFCNVYEKAKSDRLYEMSKMQLIQEYLQLEASYDKLSNSLTKINGQLENSDSSNNVLKRLADRVQELTTENLELRRQMSDIRNRDRRHHEGGHHKSSHHFSNEAAIMKSNHQNYDQNLSNMTSSEDTESDSSSSTSSSSSSSSSDSDSDSHTDLSNQQYVDGRSMILSPSINEQS